MFSYFTLDGRTPVPCDMATWEQMFADGDRRRIARTIVSERIVVSTVFLGLDHLWGDGGPPLVFETMAFIDAAGEDCQRTATWEEAEQAHRDMVATMRLREEK